MGLAVEVSLSRPVANAADPFEPDASAVTHNNMCEQRVNMRDPYKFRLGTTSPLPVY